MSITRVTYESIFNLSWCAWFFFLVTRSWQICAWLWKFLRITRRWSPSHDESAKPDWFWWKITVHSEEERSILLPSHFTGTGTFQFWRFQASFRKRFLFSESARHDLWKIGNWKKRAKLENWTENCFSDWSWLVHYRPKKISRGFKPWSWKAEKMSKILEKRWVYS